MAEGEVSSVGLLVNVEDVLLLESCLVAEAQTLNLQCKKHMAARRSKLIEDWPGREGGESSQKDWWGSSA